MNNTTDIYNMASNYFEQYAANENAETTPDRNELRVGMFTPIEALDVYLDINEHGGLDGFDWTITDSHGNTVAEGKNGQVSEPTVNEKGMEAALTEAFDFLIAPDWRDAKRYIEEHDNN